MKQNLNCLFIGDIVGKPGLKAVHLFLPGMIEKYQPDLIIANGENAADGKGITEEEANQLFVQGVDIITTGNHVWDNWKGRQMLSQNQKILRPLNYPHGNPGLGYSFIQLEEFPEIAVINLQGRTYMQSIDCPFKAADYALNSIKERTNLIFVDFHADATAEKIAFSWYLDGKVSAIFGTHTHIQTADACILPQGTGYITDAGMTGPYNSVLGLRKDIAIKRFLLQTPFKFEMGDGDQRLCGVYVKVNVESGKTEKIESFMIPQALTSYKV